MKKLVFNDSRQIEIQSAARAEWESSEKDGEKDG